MIDDGKMEHWTLRWSGVLFRALGVPILGGAVMFGLVVLLLWWLG